MRVDKAHHNFKKGDRVKVFNGGKLEGLATVVALLPQDDDYYRVRFFDEPHGLFARWVSPEWQRPDFTPAEREG